MVGFNVVRFNVVCFNVVGSNVVGFGGVGFGVVGFGVVGFNVGFLVGSGAVVVGLFVGLDVLGARVLLPHTSKPSSHVNPYLESPVSPHLPCQDPPSPQHVSPRGLGTHRLHAPSHF